jgi:hypothetical protein
LGIKGRPKGMPGATFYRLRQVTRSQKAIRLLVKNRRRVPVKLKIKMPKGVTKV